jgi:hypothetical protein
LNNLICKYFQATEKQQPKKMIIDLSAASDDGLALILMRMPVKELLLTCTQVLIYFKKDDSKN